MTDLPARTEKKLGLVIDLDTCVGCQACVTACKGWNDQGPQVGGLSDSDPYGATPSGAFLNRVHAYQVEPPDGAAQTIHFPRSCLHCDAAPCVTVCPTQARQFGDRNDPADPVGQIYKSDNWQTLKPEMHSDSRVLYLGLPREVI